MKTTLFKIMGVLFVLVMILFVSACAQKADVQADANKLSEEDIAEIKEAVALRENELITYAEATDAENAFGLFDPSGSGSYIFDLSRNASFQALKDRVRDGYGRLAGMEWKDPDMQIFVLSPEIVLTSTVNNFSHVDTLGITTGPLPRTATHVWVRKEGKWLIHSFHQSVGNPPESTE